MWLKREVALMQHSASMGIIWIYSELGVNPWMQQLISGIWVSRITLCSHYCILLDKRGLNQHLRSRQFIPNQNRIYVDTAVLIIECNNARQTNAYYPHYNLAIIMSIFWLRLIYSIPLYVCSVHCHKLTEHIGNGHHRILVCRIFHQLSPHRRW